MISQLPLPPPKTLTNLECRLYNMARGEQAEQVQDRELVKQLSNGKTFFGGE
jgi:hypothetical protein